MKQVSYEKLKESLATILSEEDEPYDPEVDESPFLKYTNAIDVIDNFIEQYKPPTFDEVVRYWRSIGYEVSVNYDNSTRITSVMQKGSGDLKHISFNWINGFLEWGQFVYSFSKEEWHAINLTFRYLETVEDRK